MIKDGDVTITAQADKAADKVTLTIDDGHGHRKTYTIDYRDPVNPTLRPEPGPMREPAPRVTPGGTTQSAAGSGSPGTIRVSGRLEPGSLTGQGGGQAPNPWSGTGIAAALAGQRPQPPGGAPVGIPMTGSRQRDGDPERGGNRWLAKEPLIKDTPADRSRAIRAGGVIGERPDKPGEA